MTYKETLLLPKTDYPMRANLPKLEALWQKHWDAVGVYHAIRERRRGKPIRMVHDGPMFANGDAHFGHMFNHILKDFLVRFLTLAGFDSPFRPGWDCHGLPIEHKVTKDIRHKYALEPHTPDAPLLPLRPSAVREACRQEALKWVDIQSDQLKRMGLLADFIDPYLTLQPDYEAGVLTVLGHLVEQGYVERKFRPIVWCAHDQTALAEAEVEYKEITTDTVYALFHMLDRFPRTAALFSMVAWTTTPWTLPGNVALAVGEDIDYSLVTAMTKEGKPQNLVVATSLVSAVAEASGLRLSTLAVCRGSELVGMTYNSPFSSVTKGRVVSASYVTADTGTGIVHTAPGHGVDDYLTAEREGLPVLCPVDEGGRYLRGTHDSLDGKMVTTKDTQDALGVAFKTSILATGKVTHSYPHCWRCKKPTITRATAQWFVKIDHNDLRQKSLDAITATTWIPAVSQNRIESMVETRPDWCISRQRHWGVPIPSLECGCGEVILTTETVDCCKDMGVAEWFNHRAQTKCPKCGQTMTQGKDILDVWMESGSSFYTILPETKEVVYIEGSDQHRGWFQSSLILSVAVDGRAPYDAVVTHGWVVDREGKKFSKRDGAPPVIDTLDKFGADVVRLFVASHNPADDLSIDEKALQDATESYRKIRNTFRFILGNLNDFTGGYPCDTPPYLGGHQIDLYILSRLNEVIKAVTDAYESFAVYQAYHALFQFCTVDLSNIYFDVIKDRLYCEDKSSASGLAARWVLSRIYSALARMYAPIIPHTAEELWDYFEDGSIFYTDFPVPNPDYDNTREDWSIGWKTVFAFRNSINTSIEELRARKEIGANEEVKVDIFAADQRQRKALINHGYGLVLLEVTKVAEIEWDDSLPDSHVVVTKSNDPKCERCWRYRDDVKDGLCLRCANAVKIRSMVRG